MYYYTGVKDSKHEMHGFWLEISEVDHKYVNEISETYSAEIYLWCPSFNLPQLNRSVLSLTRQRETDTRNSRVV